MVVPLGTTCGRTSILDDRMSRPTETPCPDLRTPTGYEQRFPKYPKPPSFMRVRLTWRARSIPILSDESQRNCRRLSQEKTDRVIVGAVKGAARARAPDATMRRVVEAIASAGLGNSSTVRPKRDASWRDMC